MFIAHLPSGYIMAKAAFRKLQTPNACWKWFLICSLVGSIAPDFDLIYFYLWDNRQHHHHSYWSHFPIIWFSLLLSLPLLKKLFRDTATYFGIFILCGCIHLILDSVVGDILWLAPFSNRAFALATVPNVVDPWWLNFFIHWSFLLEIIILLYSYKVLRTSHKSNP